MAAKLTQHDRALFPWLDRRYPIQARSLSEGLEDMADTTSFEGAFKEIRELREALDAFREETGATLRAGFQSMAEGFARIDDELHAIRKVVDNELAGVDQIMVVERKLDTLGAEFAVLRSALRKVPHTV